MIITKTPFRISFVGGGSDIEEYYSRRPGAVLSTTINKFMYISSHHFYNEDMIVAKYSQTEMVKDLAELKHPILREVLRKFSITGALEISSNADIASGTGMGSSSSFTVGLLHNMYTVLGKYVTKEQLAQDACEVEIDILKEPIGKQDQYAASFGGLNVFRFNTDNSVNVQPVHLPKSLYKHLQGNLLLFYLGNRRNASSILAEQSENIKLDASLNILEHMVGLVDELCDVLYKGNIDDFGMILHKNWVLKRKLASNISSSDIDAIYDTALKNGALGGKLLGAGAGGFLLFYCPEEKQEKLKNALASLKQVNFKFENEGSKLIYVGDEYN